MIVLDADSLMNGSTMLRMAQLMEANPKAGIIQAPPMTVMSELARVEVKRAALDHEKARPALDSRYPPWVAEQAIQTQLKEIARNRTTLVIAHRLSTIADAIDPILSAHGLSYRHKLDQTSSGITTSASGSFALGLCCCGC